MTLVYFRQEGTKIVHCFKADGADIVTTEIPPVRAVQLAAQLAEMAAFALKPAPDKVETPRE